MGTIAFLSEALGTREDAFRLLLSIIAGYPLAAIYRTFFCRRAPSVQYAYIITVGTLLYLFNCGAYTYHSFISMVLCWLIVKYLPGKKSSIALAHICFLGHLLLGYMYAESASYDITWTTPFCIMVLRYIGLVMDVYDSHRKNKEANSKSESPTAISDTPSFLEVAAFGFFFTGTLVGPQFTLKRFRAFINGQFLDEKGAVRESSIMASIQRFAAGVLYAVIHQWGLVWVPDTYFNTPEFDTTPFLWKVFWNVIWFRAVMYRYCTVWLLTEGAAILTGLAYNGKDKNGKDRWDGVRDIHIIKWELGSDFSSCVESFNCGTNTFAKNHIFKRLKWLGNKYASQAITLFYIAIWHGFHLGYFLLFAYEMLCIIAQEQLYSLIRQSPNLAAFLSQPIARPFTWLFGRLAINVSMAFSFLTFGLIKKEIWIGPQGSMYYYGYIFYMVIWPAVYFLLSNFVLKSSSKRQKSADGKAKREHDNSQKGEHSLANGYIATSNGGMDASLIGKRKGE